MDTIKILTLSIIQGITELLPVSSSGHVLVIGRLLNLDISNHTAFLSTLHLGTTLAIIVFFREELFENFFTKSKLTFFLKLLLASLPVAMIGFLFEDYIAQFYYGNLTIAILLIVVGTLFIIAENINFKTVNLKPKEVPLRKMILIGIGQTLALIPGTSRSGITTLSGMMCGLSKYSALKFGFILGIPILLGSSLYEIIKSYIETPDNSITTTSLSIVKMLPAIAMTFLVGYFALYVIERFQKKKWLTIFGIYRLTVGLLILIFTI
ncbi:undecaprenyl-diphosphate phosphatase [bacterium]|nr:undecaprenyl-diphosphate phosphatase [bacterium]